MYSYFFFLLPLQRRRRWQIPGSGRILPTPDFGSPTYQGSSLALGCWILFR